ncbi:MAG: diacylglycerol kinase family lipid kinase [Deltaproteobacteria bacterium]|nr:diacylglycerol kinase family lipid kinase [Deltaproteobacteria bacterium]
MTEIRRVLVIANPRSRGGRTAERLPEVERALRRHGLSYELVCTQRSGHASEIARAALGRDVDAIAVVGGDGTLNEVVQAYCDDAGQPIAGPDLALIPSGAGGDFRKTLDLSGSIGEAVSQLRFGRRRAVDMGVLHAIDRHARPMVRAFVNVASFGAFGAAVDSDDVAPWLGARGNQVVGSLLAVASFKNVAVRIHIDGVPFYEGKIFAVAIANGRYFGGGLKIAPHADPTDGRLDVVVLGDLSRASVLALAPKIYTGGHLGAAGVSLGGGRAIEAEPVHAWASVLLDVDGEAPGRLPLRAQLLPGALAFRA